MDKEYQGEGEEKNNIEVWGDLVSIRDLIISLAVSSITTLGGFILASDEPTKPLIYGLFGAVIGFIITSINIQPKRTFKYSDEEE